jgi:regulatory protein
MRADSASSSEPVESDHRPIELTALRLLARREHSLQELRTKLLRRGHTAAAVDVVISQLAARQLISDARFAGSWVRRGATRGQGPVRIRAELRAQGITEDLIQAEFAAADCDWPQLAAQVRARKFGARKPAASAERAKQSRFLQYRGFTADQIRAALGADADSQGPWLDGLQE